MLPEWATFSGTWPSVGYDAEWDRVPAAFVGAPHIRGRIFIVAVPQRLTRLQQRPNAANTRNRVKAGKTISLGMQMTAPELWPEWPTPTTSDGTGVPESSDQNAGFDLRNAYRWPV